MAAIVAARLPGGLVVAAAFLLGLLGNLRGPRRFADHLNERQWSLVGIGVASLFAIGGYVWVGAFSSMQASDFGVYYRCGLSRFEGIGHQIDSCQSAYMKPNLIFWERSLLYTTPVGLLLGSRPQAVELLNASLHAVTLFVLLFVTTRALSARSGTVAVALWGVFPERIYSLTLATPDNMAGALIPAAFGLLASRCQSLFSSGLALGTLIVAAGLLRSVGLFVWVAVLVGALGSHPEGRRWRVTMVLVAGLLALGTQSVLYRTLPRSLGSVSPLKMISALDLTTTQNWGVTLRWIDHIWPAIPGG